MNWLITGGCGFIGLALVRYLLRMGDGHGIRIIDNLVVGQREDLKEAAPDYSEVTVNASFPAAGEIQLIVGDIRETDLMSTVMCGADVVVHLAANTGVGLSLELPQEDCAINVMGTLNCLEAARKNNIRRFIFASSGAAVGEVSPPIHEALTPNPVSPYGVSKLAGENYCSCYTKLYDLETVALRFGNVYGPYSSRKTSVIPKFINKAQSNQALEVYGDGNQTRDFIYVEDLVEAIYLAVIREGIGGEVFQIATNSEVTINQLVDMLVPNLDNKGIKNIDVQYSSGLSGEVRRSFYDNTKAKKVLGWTPKVSFEEGLNSTVAFFVES